MTETPERDAPGVIAKPLQRGEVADLFAKLDRQPRTLAFRSPEAYREIDIDGALEPAG